MKLHEISRFSDTLDLEIVAGEAVYTPAIENRTDILVKPSDFVRIVDKSLFTINPGTCIIINILSISFLHCIFFNYMQKYK